MVHLHLHSVTAEDIAAILARDNHPGDVLTGSPEPDRIVESGPHQIAAVPIARSAARAACRSAPAAQRRSAIAAAMRDAERPPGRAYCASPDDLPALGVDMSRMAVVARW